LARRELIDFSRSAALLGDPEFPNILAPATLGERIARFQELYRLYSRLDLSSEYDRPTAIDGLQQRLLRTMDVNGGFGILDDPSRKELLFRGLLWYRGADTRSLEQIAFPSDRERVPSWSWMSVSGGIDYLSFDSWKWRRYEWQVIQPPWSCPPIRTPNAFHGQARSFHLSIARVNEYQLTFDNPLDSALSESKALVLAIERDFLEIEDKRHYVLVVRPKADLSPDGMALYERIGAGYMPGRCLNADPESCTLV